MVSVSEVALLSDDVDSIVNGNVIKYYNYQQVKMVSDMLLLEDNHCGVVIFGAKPWLVSVLKKD